MIRSPTLEDKGQYTCTVSNEDGEDSASSQVDITGKLNPIKCDIMYQLHCSCSSVLVVETFK